MKFTHLFYTLAGLLLLLLVAGFASAECESHQEFYNGLLAKSSICWDEPPNPYSDGDLIDVWCDEGTLYVDLMGEPFTCDEFGCPYYSPGVTYTKYLSPGNDNFFALCYDIRRNSQGDWVYSWSNVIFDDLVYEAPVYNNPAPSPSVADDPTGSNVPGEKKTLLQWIYSILDLDFFQYILNKLGLASLYSPASGQSHSGGGYT